MKKIKRSSPFDQMAQQILYEFGKTRLSDLRSTRRYEKVDIDDGRDVTEIVKRVQSVTPIDLSSYTTEIVSRSTQPGFFMKWHIDDVAVVKLSKTHTPPATAEIIGNRYLLFNNKKRPVYTAVIYLSKYGVDFTGGEFEFIDERIVPRKNHVLFFDSREVHRVLPVKTGTRDTMLIKYYG
jgi:hypothetical protein